LLVWLVTNMCKKNFENWFQERDASLRLLAREANYAKMVLEETLEEIGESGTFAALAESVGKSRERNRERDQVKILETICEWRT